MKKIFMICSGLVITSAAYAQGILTGKVTDAQTGEPLMGVTVREEGSAKSVTSTNDQGEFRLNLSKEKARVMLSYIGYERKSFDVAPGQKVTFQLTAADNTLGEAVVTGYGGTTVRSKLVNSIAKVDNEALTSSMVSNVAQALSGTVSGVRVVQSSGNPNAAPSVILRGGTDYNGSGSPLVVVDGMIRSSMADVNPNDIESFEVMKDAGATAIYGSRANNGVILITTKKGKQGDGKINFNTKISWNYFNNPYNFLGSQDYLYYMRRAYKFAADKGYGSLSSLTGTQPYGTGNKYEADGNKSGQGIWGVYLTNALSADVLAKLQAEGWRTMTDPVTGAEMIFCEHRMEDFNINTPSFSQDYNLSYSGGNEKGHYYAGLGFNKSEGSAVDNWNRRLSAIFNADYRIKDWLKSSSSFNFSTTKYQGLPLTQENESNYFSRVLSYPTTYRAYNANGELVLGRSSSDGNQTFNINNYERNYSRQKFSFSQAFDVDLMQDLRLTLKGDWFYEYYNYEYFFHTFLSAPGSTNNRHNSYAQSTNDLTQTYNAILNYNKTFGKHTIAAMLGWEFWSQRGTALEAGGYNPDNNYFMDLSYTLNKEGARTINSDHYKLNTMSYFARVNYDYADKYLASFTIRRDGISKLFKDQRWGTFPGLSLGWAFYKEDFMKKYENWLSFGKLRASWGLNGNVNPSYVGNYTVQGSYGSSTYNGNLSYYLNAIPNPYLTWEKSRTFEFGVDLGFWNNRLQASFTAYDRRTSDKYASITIPGSSGYTSITSNNGTLRNRGLEMEFKYRILNTNDWKVNAGLNLAYNKNTVIKLPNNGYEKNRQGGFQVYTGNGADLKWVGGYAEGETPGDLYVFIADGLYRSMDEVPEHLIDKSTSQNGGSNKVLYGRLDNVPGGLPIQAGDVRWRDINKDGVIDDYDRVKIGNTVPKWTGGFNASASWKGLTLSARLDFALGYWLYDYRTAWIMGNMQGSFNTIDNVFDTWSPDNVNAKYPIYTWADQLGARNYDRRSSIFAYHGDYLAFRDITLSYAMPEKVLRALRATKLELSVSGQNLGYITSAPYVYSPEVSGNNGGYPLPRMLVFGLNVTF